MAESGAQAPAYRHPLTMGLRPAPLDSWLTPQPGDDDVLAQRRALIARIPADVTACLPPAHDAVAELTEQATLRGRVMRAPSPETQLRVMGEAIAEDLCVLTPRDDAYVLTAGVVCFPNRWRLADKIGKSILAVHDPVPEYATRLAHAVDRFLADLAPLHLMVRANWGLTDTDALHLPDPGAPLDLADPGRAWLRTERQSFLKLPRSGAVVFAIRTELRAWGDMDEAERAAILDAVGRLSPGWRRYKGLAVR